MRNCKKICYQWGNDKKGNIWGLKQCKYFHLHSSKPTCDIFGKVKSMVTGEVFYLGRVIKNKLNKDARNYEIERG